MTALWKLAMLFGAMATMPACGDDDDDDDCDDDDDGGDDNSGED